MPGFSSLQDVEVVEAVEGYGPPPDLPQNAYEVICRGANLNPQAPALSFLLSVNDHRTSQMWSYATLLGRITQAANFFNGIGVKEGSVIASVLPNLPETHFAVWGGQVAGIVAALNPLFEGPVLAELFNAAGTSVLVTLAPFPGTDTWIKLQPHPPAIRSLRHLVLVNLADRVHGAAQCAAQMQKNEALRLPGPQGVHDAVPMSVRTHDFNSAIQAQRTDGLNSRRHTAAQDASLYFCISGTTDLPRIAMRTHGNEVANVWSMAQVLGVGIGPGKVVFCGLLLFHVNGVLVIGLLPFSRGAHVVLGTSQGYRGDGVIQRFWEIVEHHCVNLFNGVSTLYASLLQVPVGERDVRPFEYDLCGAALMSVEVFHRSQEQAGIKILEGYGLTEVICASSANSPMGERRLDSISLCVPIQQMKTVVLDEGGVYLRNCVVDEVGVLVVSGPNVFSGYRQAGQNEGLWVDTGDGQRWFNTGDLARQDEQSYFWFTGHKKELIIHGGHNIDPLTIETPLHRHPAAQIATAVGRPDVHAGELSVAYVQLRVGASVTGADLLTFPKAETAERAALSRQVNIIETMPLIAVGKIFKSVFKYRETRDVPSTALKDAGIASEALEVAEDKSRGLVASVKLDASVSIAVAREVLGRFPFPFSVS